jgi:hypothetical protein
MTGTPSWEPALLDAVETSRVYSRDGRQRVRLRQLSVGGLSLFLQQGDTDMSLLAQHVPVEIRVTFRDVLVSSYQWTVQRVAVQGSTHEHVLGTWDRSDVQRILDSLCVPVCVGEHMSESYKDHCVRNVLLAVLSNRVAITPLDDTVEGEAPSIVGSVASYASGACVCACVYVRATVCVTQPVCNSCERHKRVRHPTTGTPSCMDGGRNAVHRHVPRGPVGCCVGGASVSVSCLVLSCVSSL